MPTSITVTYKAFSNDERPITSATIEIPTNIDSFNDAGYCELMYEVTNLQDDIFAFTGNKTKLSIWNLLKPVLPSNRTHTSLSVGDEVTINNNTYRCESTGWALTEKVNA